MLKSKNSRKIASLRSTRILTKQMQMRHQKERSKKERWTTADHSKNLKLPLQPSRS